MSLTPHPPIWRDYAEFELEEWAWKLHAALVVARDHARSDPDHLLNPSELRRIAAMDAMILGFEEWAR